MKNLIFNKDTRQCIGILEGNINGYNGSGLYVAAPTEPIDDISNIFLADDNITIIPATTSLLAFADAARKSDDTEGVLLKSKIRIEKQWAISEIRASDYIAPLKDHSHYYAYIMYRASLREYYNLTDFTGVERPILDKTIKNSLTKFQFMSRFTSAERIAINTAATQSAELADWLDLFKLTEEMNLNDPQTIAGVQMLEAGGIIGVGRANEILA